MKRIAEKFYPRIKNKIAIAAFEFAIFKKGTIFVEGESDKLIYKSRATSESSDFEFIVGGSKKNVIALVKMHENTGLAYGIVDSDEENLEINSERIVKTNRINLEAEILNNDSILEYENNKYYRLFSILNTLMHHLYIHNSVIQCKKPLRGIRSKDFKLIIKCKSIDSLIEKKFFELKNNYVEKCSCTEKNKIYASKYFLAILMKENNENDESKYFINKCENRGIDLIIKKINLTIKKFS
ncbi:MAG: hypothetical protein HRT99_04400 [Mycoplasmatales bacterium]|nr:hypothetical protein [Mycoplasmatales bacterium]